MSNAEVKSRVRSGVSGQVRWPAGEAHERRAEPISPVVLTGCVRIVEPLALAAMGWALYPPAANGTDHPVSTVVTIVSITGAGAILLHYLGTYQLAAFRNVFPQLGRLCLAWAVACGIAGLLSAGFDLEAILPWRWLGTWLGAGLGVLFASRLILARLVGKWAREGRLTRRCVIVGGGSEGESLLKALALGGDPDLHICGIFDDRDDERSPPIVAGVPKLGTVDDLVNYTRSNPVDLVLVSLPLTAENRLLQMVRKLWVLPVDIRLAAHISRLHFRPRTYSYIGGVPALPITDRPITDWNMVSKALFDRVLAAILLLALSPVLLATALAIKLDSKGPILFRQRRLGFNNEVIKVLKFRSLYHEHADYNARRSVTKNDPRVTRVGRFIRKTSIDELPQLWNVLRGELSLVGPRPHAVEAPTANRIWDEVIDGYFARHRVKPGLTGWAQINGWRGELDSPEKLQCRVEHDLHYIENWSLLFDIYILLRTPIALLNSKNAY